MKRKEKENTVKYSTRTTIFFKTPAVNTSTALVFVKTNTGNAAAVIRVTLHEAFIFSTHEYCSIPTKCMHYIRDSLGFDLKRSK